MLTQKVEPGQDMQYAEHLSRMIQCETISTGSENNHVAFGVLHAVLAACFPLVHQKLERTVIHGDSLLYRWPGQGPDAGKAPIIFLAHQDVVEATGPWRHPPFAGDISDGFIWGRGALDTKGSLCALFEAIEGLLAEGFVPHADIYLSSSHNEEPMGDGAPHIVRCLADRGVKPALVLDEGGAIVDSVLPGVTCKTAVIGTTEKGYLNIRFTARSQGGHASTPPKHSPIGRLSELVYHIEKKSPFPACFNPVVRQLFTSLAPYMTFPLNMLFGNLWLFGPIMRFVLPALGGEAKAMVMTTCAFTMSQGSGAPNVLPEEASITANLRIGIHQTVDEVVATLEKMAARLDIRCDVLYAHEASPVSPLGGTGFEHLAKALSLVFPEVVLAPYTMLAASDAHHFCELTPHVYRFTPFELSSDLRQTIHGLDERLPVAALSKAVAFYQAMIRET